MVFKTHKLKDGRLISFEVYGDIENGVPVIFSHGLSDSRLLKHYDDDLTKTLGVRIIAVDQPGVGKSTNVPRKDRTLINYARDIEELVNDALQLDTFAVAGHSGGGPHALAIAHHLPDRVSCGVLAAPAPPFDEACLPGIIEGTFGFSFAKYILRFLQCFPFIVDGLCYLMSWWGNRNVRGYTESVAVSDRSNGNPETFLGNPKQTKVFHDSFQAGLEQGPVGLQGMFQAVFFNPDWGFDIRNDIPQHFDFFMSALDTIIKPNCGQIMSTAMPDATVTTWPDAGHYSFVDRQCWIDFWSAIVKAHKKKKKDT